MILVDAMTTEQRGRLPLMLNTKERELTRAQAFKEAEIMGEENLYKLNRGIQ